MSAADFYKSLSAEQKQAAQIPMSPSHKRSAPPSPLSSSPANTTNVLSSSPKLVKKKPKSANTMTKDVNREMKELYAKKKLSADAVLNTAEKTVGEYLIDAWLKSQKLGAFAAVNKENGLAQQGEAAEGGAASQNE